MTYFGTVCQLTTGFSTWKPCSSGLLFYPFLIFFMFRLDRFPSNKYYILLFFHASLNPNRLWEELGQSILFRGGNSSFGPMCVETQANCLPRASHSLQIVVGMQQLGFEFASLLLLALVPRTNGSKASLTGAVLRAVSFLLSQQPKQSDA